MKIDGRWKGPEVWGEKFDRCATICVKCSARLRASVFRVLPDAFHMWNALFFIAALRDATRAIHLLADHLK
jgi:hypothetical protein